MGGVIKYFYMLNILFLLVNPGAFSWAETAQGSGSQQRVNPSNFFTELYIPQTPEFSKNRNTAISYADPKWNALSLTQKAEYAQGVVDAIVAYKGADYSYINSNVIICLINKESDYIPNRRTPTSNSTASGLGQVTNTTITELLKKRWFEPLMPGFNKDVSASTYRENSARSIIEQLNLIVSTFHLKRAEAGSTDLTTILKRYRGSSAAVNTAYANSIMDCKNCVDTNGITEACLNKVK